MYITFWHRWCPHRQPHKWSGVTPWVSSVGGAPELAEINAFRACRMTKWAEPTCLTSFNRHQRCQYPCITCVLYLWPAWWHPFAATKLNDMLTCNSSAMHCPSWAALVHTCPWGWCNKLKTWCSHHSWQTAWQASTSHYTEQRSGPRQPLMNEPMHVLNSFTPTVLSTSHVRPLFCDASISTSTIVHLIPVIMIRAALICIAGIVACSSSTTMSGKYLCMHNCKEPAATG